MRTPRLAPTPRRALAAAAAVAAAGALATPAHAAFPGRDGRIATAGSTFFACSPALRCIGRGGLVTVDPAGGDVRPFDRYFSGRTEPEYSPDGTHLVAVTDGVLGDADRAYTGPADGPVDRLVRARRAGAVVPTAATADRASWTPDGRLLLTTGSSLSIRDGALRPVRTILTYPPSGTVLSDATMSPDGRTIAFTIPNGDQRIWLVDADGGDLRPLTRREPSGIERYAKPDWSPDGRRLVYVHDEPDALESTVEVADPATGATTTVPVGADLVDDVVWSPSGTRLAYRVFSPPRVQVVVHDLATGDETTALDEPYRGNGFRQGLSWQPLP